MMLGSGAVCIWEPGGSSPQAGRPQAGPRTQPWSPGVSVNSEKGQGLWRWRPPRRASRADAAPGDAECSPLFSALLCHPPGPLPNSVGHTLLRPHPQAESCQPASGSPCYPVEGDQSALHPAVALGRACCRGCCTKQTWALCSAVGCLGSSPQGRSLQSPSSKELLPSPHGAPALRAICLISGLKNYPLSRGRRKAWAGHEFLAAVSGKELREMKRQGA